MKKQYIRRTFLLLAALLIVELMFCGVAFAEPEEQLSLNVTADSYQVEVGDTLTYTVTLTNNGTETAVRTSVIIILSRGQLADMRPDVTEGTSITQSESNWRWTVPSLSPGESKQFQLTGTVQSGPALYLNAWIVGESGERIGATGATVMLPVLSIEMTADKSSAAPGDALIYTVTATNTGGSGSDFHSVLIKIDMPQDKMQLIDDNHQEGDIWEENTWRIIGLRSGEQKTIVLKAEVTNVKMDEIVTCSASIAEVMSLTLTEPITVSSQFTVVCGSHSGGTATCTKKAVCGFCGEEYGEIDPSNHTNLVKTAARAATCTEAGNIAYWHCDACDKYFSDKNGTTEITLEGTVLKATGHSYQNGKCTVCGAVAAGDEDIQPPKTGDNSNMVLWIALLLIAGSGFVLAVIVQKRRA